ncbi:ketopantoate reductase family protein [Actinopolymorpha singaporensis]|uniref:2-dehydropantoate 2-reductase n=1 Tax=Actinopolymorpha singaporensis TaxID=117157 RepID=A0A1H1NBY7_9ACTN|nr:2-dehydropantoate 2-reductase [Actinopolymorpha singaporensis]SDR96467.1 2-dehydropantoate 2-reductase [Actinopolymorpha singaporensis]
MASDHPGNTGSSSSPYAAASAAGSSAASPPTSPGYTGDVQRFVVYGAGAIGGVLGARLHAAGHEVVLIARGAHLAAIRAGGLRVESPDGSETLRIPAVSGPDEIDWRPGDVVLLAMKSTDTEAAVRALAAVADPATPVVCVQNGVANEPTVLRHFANVYGVHVMFPATHLTPGVVQAQSAPVTGILDLGRYPRGVDGTAERIAAAFRSATFACEPRPDIMRGKYVKLLGNLGNAIDALCGRPNADDTDDADDPDGGDPREIVERLRAEGTAVLEAAGIEFMSFAEDRARRGDLIQVRPVNGQARTGSSSWQSLARSTGAIEADHLNGEIVLLGRLHGVPTPANELARRLANQAARAGDPPGSLRVADFWKLLAAAEAAESDEAVLPRS